MFTFQAWFLLPENLSKSYKPRSKYPPAEPEALRLLPPQRGLIATGGSKGKNKSKSISSIAPPTEQAETKEEHTPGTVKLCLPPRQSRGNSLRIRISPH